MAICLLASLTLDPSLKIHLKKKGDKFYIFSDGFQDQFGGPHERKYLTKNFRNLLGEISGLPAERQKEKLKDELTRWRAAREQTDDIIVIGISV